MKISNVLLVAVCLFYFGAECEATLCVEDYHVVNHICVACLSGQSNLAGDDPSVRTRLAIRAESRRIKS